ncbi:uncharacterized protein LOC141900275 isoform X2 [Tubulanus polymorphus]|uniref:uncharacterized protein LOC141900275 isoform X2 n=1 Tax=Tubulanus polymorphus TaxID=672921 RepID=UPI003DA500B9
MQRLARHSVASVVSTQSRDSIESANMYNHRSSISVVRGPGGAGNRWAKLRTTVKATNIVSEPAKRKRKASNLSRQDSFLKRFSTRHGVHGNDSDGEGDEEKSTIGRNSLECKSVRRKFVIHPVENVMFLWLGFITAACLYNIWTSIAREAFTEIQDGYLPVWFACDAICDFLYLFDVVVQLRTGFLEKGLLVYNSKKLAHHYVKSHYFIVDLITLLPLDLLQLYIGIHPLLRFPRFLKCYRAGQFKNMVESRTMYPNLWRVVNLCHILFLFSHWFAAFYYLISKSEDYTGVWAYPKPVGPYADVTRKYLKSLYWSTLTLTTIGDLPPPDTNWQYVFTILSYLLGVFCFATIVGQVGNVITNRNANRLEFERLLDGAKNYMRTHNVPPDMQRRVQRWYDYAWSRGRVNGGGDINSLGLLPDKLKTELALHVNLETLKKVTIFQECQPEFLHDLVLKMRAYIFTPGDLVCRKGEVAREMFIIADGILEVISDTGEVLTQMGAGDFFGEIGILNLDGGINRRTADVRSVGYSELFTLSREDVLAALKDHPEAEALIKQYGNRRLKEMAERKRTRTASILSNSEQRILKGFRVETDMPHRSKSDSGPLYDLDKDETVDERRHSNFSLNFFRRLSASFFRDTLSIGGRDNDSESSVETVEKPTPWYKMAEFGLRPGRRPKLLRRKVKNKGKEYHEIKEPKQSDSDKNQVLKAPANVQINIEPCSDDDSVADSIMTPIGSTLQLAAADEDLPEIQIQNHTGSTSTIQKSLPQVETPAIQKPLHQVVPDATNTSPANNLCKSTSTGRLGGTRSPSLLTVPSECAVNEIEESEDDVPLVPEQRRSSDSDVVCQPRQVPDTSSLTSFRRLSQCSNNSESQGIDIRPTPSPESDTSLASGRSREVNANMDTVSDVLESMKQVLILKLGSGNEALVKRVKDLEDINDQQSTKIKLLEREIQTLKGEFVDDEAVSVSPITQHHEKSPSVATTSNCADPDGVDDVMDTKL